MEEARAGGHIRNTGDTFGDAWADGFAALRTREFGYLDEGGHTYLDHTGAGLAPRSLVTGSAERITGGLFGNPHSESPASRASGLLLTEARRAVLRHFDADPAEYAVIFTPNATGALRLVGEAYPFARGSRLVMSLDNHNSVNGLREYARARGAATAYVPVSGSDLRLDEERLRAALTARGRGPGLPGGSGLPRRPGRPGRHGLLRRRSGAGPRGLLAYPAQSNFTGVRYPLEWIARAQEHGYDVLLDAAAFVPTNTLDLGRFHPDFTVVSWYKVFGHPTGIGSLIARREALAKLRRPWFSGGTIYAVSAQAQWHVLADDEAAFEDGTVNFLSIPDVTAGLEWIDRLGMDRVHAHVTALTGQLLAGLQGLRHSDGSPMVRVYGPEQAGPARGGTVALNLLGADGRIVDERIVTRDSAALGISLRTGCFCNPGAGEAAFALPLGRLRSAASRQLRSLEDYLEVLRMPTAGAVRVSLGVSSQPRDIETFLTFVTRAYRDRVPGVSGLAARVGC